MNAPDSVPAAIAPSPSVAKWWGKYVPDKDPTRSRLVFRWGRILAVTGALCLVGYFSLATILWGYYTIYRKIPSVSWSDVAVLPRFSRVQAAIGAYYFADAKQLWEKKDYVRAIFTGRAAVLKAPQNLEARLFLADCWRQANRTDEAIRTLRDGIEFDAGDPRLQEALVETLLTTSHFKELLKLLREELPARGVRLLDGPNRNFQLAEVRAVLETADANEAEKVVASHRGLPDLPVAAPLLARIDWELDRRDAALARLRVARDSVPTDSGIQEAYVETTLLIGNLDEAKTASRVFLNQFPNLMSAQLRFLEAHASRQGADRTQWLEVCVRFLVQFHGQPAALVRLASLAASQGWTDLTFLLYQVSLSDNLTGFPFAIFYLGSLVKSGDFAEADTVWHELSIRNSAQMVSAAYLGAMVASGLGRESEALQIVDQLRRETASDPFRRKILVKAFREFGFPKIADDLAGPQS
jgi:tetratricopeptide (TPR) repeat protein